MKIELKPGEKVEITLFGTDGLFTVDFNSKRNRKLTVRADLPDTRGRVGELYCEDFGRPISTRVK